ncbi:16S rRNA (cytosine(1402)-N(4))-methyltransferase RsmH [Roseimaritima sediminicola]|uniref:16S rRNA (cytosine(1402)-N(4))-methyltransferase RsmH n=1 Tax=Roseimaritima sediminicola TaxID=2662066 RepID=UPI001EEF09FB|nr:16S rRNA (cytosine(1402)-N(4))-methyltransferase RsmH [Roseimaritima sediminicola]
MNTPTIHVPVMPEESIAALEPGPGKTIIDGTFGGGGHSSLLAASVLPGGRVIGLDRDEGAVERSQQIIERLAVHAPQAAAAITVYCASYHQIDRALAAEGLDGVDGILLDLGLSSDQLADRSRGFSFSVEGPLDLRFDTSSGEPASRLLKRWNEKQIADVIYRYGEERFSRRIARRIVQARQEGQAIETTTDLAELVRRCVPRSKNHDIDPATRTFQALRIAANDELQILEQALSRAADWLNPDGRIAVISFHSLEDRIVKNQFRDCPRLEVLTRKPLRPSDTETQHNPRARSAKLRIARRRRDEEMPAVQPY